MSSFLGVTCPELNDIDNGTVMIKRNTFEGEAIYSCVLGFMIEGSETRVCGADGMWSGSEPSCVRKSSYNYLIISKHIYPCLQYTLYSILSEFARN